MVNRVLANNLNLDGIPINTSGAFPIKSQRIILNSRPPTVNDKSPQYNIGTIWVVLNRSNTDLDKYQYWYLADNALSQPGNVANATWLRFAAGSGPFASQITTIDDGNVAIPLANNWNFDGIAPITVTTPVNLGDTIEFGTDGTVAVSYPTDSGTAVPAAGVLNVFGSVGVGHVGDNMNTSGTGNTVFVHLNKSLHMPASNASGTEGVWFTGATGSPLAGGNRFISNIGTANTFVGELSGNLTLTTASAENNSGFGARSLNSLTTATDNVAAGYLSGASLTTSGGNTLIGSEAGTLLATGSGSNVAVGAAALDASVSDTALTAIGTQALSAANGVTGAVAVGYQSQAGITTGSNNTSTGHSSMLVATTAANNCCYGFEAGKAMTTALRNVVIGQGSGSSITSGRDNILIGSGAGASLTTGFQGIAIGTDALSTIANWTPNNVPDIAIGNNALKLLQTPGGASTAIGDGALQSATVTQENVAIGASALTSLTTGIENNANGTGTLALLTTGSLNTACGFRCAVRGDGPGLLTGDRNVLMGASAGANFSGAESSNICIGAQTGTAGQTVGNNGDNNTLRIGYATGATAGLLNRAFIQGIFGITTGVNDAIPVLIDSAGQLGTVSSSLRYKKDIEDIGEESELIYKLDPVSFVYKNDESNTRTYGLIAEEVNDHLPQLVVRDIHGEVETLRYQHLPILMLNEMKKLKERLDHVEKRLDRCKCR